MASKVEKLEGEVHIKASAERFHDVLSGKTHVLGNICSDQVQRIDMHKGEWGLQGSIIIWNYVHDGKACVAKELVEVVDRENKKIIFKVLEGELLEKYKSFRFIGHFIPQEEGSLVRWTMEYEKLNDQIPDPHTMLQFDIDMTKKIDAYLMAHDDK